MGADGGEHSTSEENKKWLSTFTKSQKSIIAWDEFGDNEGIVKGELDPSL